MKKQLPLHKFIATGGDPEDYEAKVESESEENLEGDEEK
jgi:hypothetical protein